jgi:hypothetical protein
MVSLLVRLSWYVTYGTVSVVMARKGQECLCGHDMCGWCTYASPEVPVYLSTYQSRISDPATCDLDKL